MAEPMTTPHQPARAFWETPREISHQEADDAAIRLINSHFKNDAERARVSIPANPERDDDLIIRSYIRQQMRLSAAKPPASGVDAVAVVDEGWSTLSGLRLVIAAWEALPGGRNYTKSDVQRWLVEEMKPAIDAARAVIAGRKNDLLSDLVSRFATALLEKLRAAEKKYGFADDWLIPNWKADLLKQLSEHVAKGDPRDVAAYCAFAWHHGWSLSPAVTSGSEAGGEQWSAEQIATIWTAAMTAACNIVIHRQNDLNDEDGPMDVLNEQGQIIHQIKKWLEPDAAYLEELRAMLGAKPAPPAVDGQRVKALEAILQDAEPYIEVLHSTLNAPDTRKTVWKLLKRIRACLATEERADV